MCDLRMDSFSDVGRVCQYGWTEFYTPSHLEEIIALSILKENKQPQTLHLVSIHHHYIYNNTQQIEEDCGYGYYYDTDVF